MRQHAADLQTAKISERFTSGRTGLGTCISLQNDRIFFTNSDVAGSRESPQEQRTKNAVVPTKHQARRTKHLCFFPFPSSRLVDCNLRSGDGPDAISLITHEAGKTTAWN